MHPSDAFLVAGQRRESFESFSCSSDAATSYGINAEYDPFLFLDTLEHLGPTVTVIRPTPLASVPPPPDKYVFGYHLLIKRSTAVMHTRSNCWLGEAKKLDFSRRLPYTTVPMIPSPQLTSTSAVSAKWEVKSAKQPLYFAFCALRFSLGVECYTEAPCLPRNTLRSPNPAPDARRPYRCRRSFRTSIRSNSTRR